MALNSMIRRDLKARAETLLTLIFQSGSIWTKFDDDCRTEVDYDIDSFRKDLSEEMVLDSTIDSMAITYAIGLIYLMQEDDVMSPSDCGSLVPILTEMKDKLSGRSDGNDTSYALTNMMSIVRCSGLSARYMTYISMKLGKEKLEECGVDSALISSLMDYFSCTASDIVNNLKILSPVLDPEDIVMEAFDSWTVTKIDRSKDSFNLTKINKLRNMVIDYLDEIKEL